MSLIKRTFSMFTMRCFFGVVIGVCLLASAPALVKMFSHQENIVKVTTRAIKFPETEVALDKLAEQLARDGEAMSKIEPAAGDITAPLPPTP